MRAGWLVVAAGLVGCGSSDGSAPDAHVSTESGPLGMNDVSILLPLPPATASPVIATIANPDLVPRDLFARLVVMPGDVLDPYDAFHLVAIRFDLCDRPTPGACNPADDGRLRLVFQPLFDSMGAATANDVALHAFYPIPNGELPAVVDELRRLAVLGGTPVTDPLHPTTAVRATGYADRVRTLVMTYASAAKLTRLTLFAQNAMTASLNWAFRGVERTNGSFVDIQIPDLAQPQQRTVLVGGDTTYQTMPVADAPTGLALALDATAFGAASPADRTRALEALAAAQNPLRHTAETVQCVGCHVSTFLTARRAAVAGVDPVTVAGRYGSAYDLSTAAGVSTTNNRSLRAFGYLFTEPAISQRVANDTAQVLVEIDQRYPPAK